MSLVGHDVLKCVCHATVLLRSVARAHNCVCAILLHMHLCNYSGTRVEAFTLTGWLANWMCHAVAGTLT